MEKVRYSVSEDAALLASNLRDEDLREIEAAGTADPLVALEAGFECSRHCLTVVDESNTPLTMFGVAPSPDPLVGYVWLLSSPALDQYKIKFLRNSSRWVQAFHVDYPILTNLADARNTVHLKWLKWLGFTFINKVPGAGPGNFPFYEFVRLKDV